MERILVSACLLGEAVRYDGKNNKVDDDLLQQWIDQHRVVSFCPEVAAGLAVPRIAAEISGGDGNDVLAGSAIVIDKTGHNVTGEFITGAQLALSICQQFDIKLAVLARRSPSCGNNLIYDGSFNGTTLSGVGVTTALLQQHDIRVFNQTELADAADFISQIS